MPPTRKVNTGAKRMAQDAAIRLANLIRKVPWRVVSVEKLRELTGIGEKEMTRLRKLAQIDVLTDPWAGGTDTTSPEEFWKWYWGKRRELERDYFIDHRGKVQKHGSAAA